MKKIIVFALILVLCLASLSSCTYIDLFKSVYNDVYSHGMESITMVQEFTVALIEEDCEKALGYLHPDSTITKEELDGIILALSDTHGIAFPRYFEFSKPDFDAKAGMDENTQLRAKYIVNYTLTINEVDLEVSCVVLQTPEGFGVLTYSLE